MQTINASNWLELHIAEKIFYSPNPKIIELIKKDPKIEFWHSYYSAFACIIVDKCDNSAKAIRDHFGLEPCFYTKTHDKFIFASNIPDIIKHINSSIQINHYQIMHLLLNTVKNCSEYSDETHYKEIYRVEPGTILDIKNNHLVKNKFWHLDIHSPEINYKNSNDYLEHYNQLMFEGTQYQLSDGQTIASEFSGGLDSSSIVTMLKQLNVNPTLFMHVTPDGSDRVDDMSYALEVIKTLKLDKVYQIDASDFNLLDVIHECSNYFAGAPNYLFGICANNIHKAVAQHGFNTLFSGFGGDEAASAHAPLVSSIAQHMKNKHYQIAWNELTEHYYLKGTMSPSKLKRFLQLMKFSQPKLFNLLNDFTSIPAMLQHYWQRIPYFPGPKFYNSIREYEYELLQGRLSQHVRMRVEDSAIISKAMGFSYKYPLLYPKLIEFCFKLPITQKRNHGVNRLLIRKFLAQYLPSSVYNKHQKIGSIMPATMDKITISYANKEYDEAFKNIPYRRELKWIINKYSKHSDRNFDKEIPLYSLATFVNSEPKIKYPA